MAYTELIIFKAMAMPTCDTYVLHIATVCNIEVEELRVHMMPHHACHH